MLVLLLTVKQIMTLDGSAASDSLANNDFGLATCVASDSVANND